MIQILSPSILGQGTEPYFFHLGLDSKHSLLCEWLNERLLWSTYGHYEGPGKCQISVVLFISKQGIQKKCWPLIVFYLVSLCQCNCGFSSTAALLKLACIKKVCVRVLRLPAAEHKLWQNSSRMHSVILPWTNRDKTESSNTHILFEAQDVVDINPYSLIEIGQYMGSKVFMSCWMNYLISADFFLFYACACLPGYLLAQLYSRTFAMDEIWIGRCVAVKFLSQLLHFLNLILGLAISWL